MKIRINLTYCVIVIFLVMGTYILRLPVEQILSLLSILCLYVILSR